MLSIDYKFIFIHIPKTAGTSITSALVDLPDKKFSRLRELLLYPRCVRSWRISQHDSALNIRSKVGKKHYDQFFKFAVVRNPWDLMVSTYHWWDQKAVKHSVFDKDTNLIHNMDGFSDFVHSRYGAHMINEFRGNILDWITDERGNIIVDYIAKMEQLPEDWKEICNRIGIPKTPLPHENASERRHYRNYYTEETKDLIAWRFQQEIEIFGYEF